MERKILKPIAAASLVQNDYNSVIIFYQVSFTSSYWKCGFYQQGTTAACNKTRTEASSLFLFILFSWT